MIHGRMQTQQMRTILFLSSVFLVFVQCFLISFLNFWNLNAIRNSQVLYFTLGTDYKTVLEEINKFCRNLSASPYAKPALRYQNGRRNSFAGNLSTVERRSFFNHTDSAVEIPCGFFKEFPVRESGDFFGQFAFFIEEKILVAREHDYH